MTVHPSNESRSEAPSSAGCALCGEPFADPAQVRTLGIAPVAVCVCADLDGCTGRYLVRRAAHGSPDGLHHVHHRARQSAAATA